jgi:hypothetical protein
MALVAALLFTLTSASEESHRLTLLLDTSNSMKDMMGNIRACGLIVVDRLGEQDRAQVMTVSGKAGSAREFTSSRTELSDAIRSIGPATGTSALRNALFIAIKSGSVEQGDPQHHAIAVVSDGDDTSSRVSEDQVEALAGTSRARIFSILLPTRAKAEHGWLRRLANTTGARSWQPNDADELKSACEELARDWKRPSSGE